MSALARALTLVMFLMSWACSQATAGEPKKQKPLTTFRPDKDFFQVPNTGVSQSSWNGACLGIVESAITHWDSYAQNPGTTKRLADLGAAIVQTRTKERGEEFLKQINRFAHNQSNETAATPPQAGDRLADLLFADLNRTHKPQALGLELPNGRRHAVVVWDAQKLANGKVIFSVGDPSYPGRNNLMLAYDPDAKNWVDLDYPVGAFPEGNIKPVFVRWDEKNQRAGTIPDRDKFEKLFQRVEVATRNPGITAFSIGRELAMETPLHTGAPETVETLDRPPSKPVTRPPSKPDTDFEAKKAALKAEMRAHVQRYKSKQGREIPVEDIEKERKWVDDWNKKGRDLARRWKELTGKEEMSDQDLRDVGLK